MLKRIINAILSIIELVLFARLFFILFKVGHSSQFAAWIYKISGFLVAPFENILDPFKIGSAVFDLSTLIALVVYAIAGGIIIKLVSRSDVF